MRYSVLLCGPLRTINSSNFRLIVSTAPRLWTWAGHALAAAVINFINDVTLTSLAMGLLHKLYGLYKEGASVIVGYSDSIIPASNCSERNKYEIFRHVCSPGCATVINNSKPLTESFSNDLLGLT